MCRSPHSWIFIILNYSLTGLGAGLFWNLVVKHLASNFLWSLPHGQNSLGECSMIGATTREEIEHYSLFLLPQVVE